MHLQKVEKWLLGLASVLIGFLFVILFRAHGVNGNTTTETTVPSLIQTEQENQQIFVDNKRLQQELDKYEQGQNAATAAYQQLQEARLNAGVTAVFGPGVRITLDDSKRVVKPQEDSMFYLIHEQYIRQICNALWNGGAEAIAVNGQRMTANTEVFCGGSYIQINGTRQMPPYIIKAIGDSNNLSAALNFYGWFRLGDLQKQDGITRQLEIVEKITIPAGEVYNYHYAEPVKEGT